MKVKELVRKVSDFGTDPHVYIQKGGNILGGGNPDDIVERFGMLKVESFVASSRGEIKVFVS